MLLPGSMVGIATGESVTKGPKPLSHGLQGNETDLPQSSGSSRLGLPACVSSAFDSRDLWLSAIESVPQVYLILSLMCYYVQ
jgi:hypothetical protein